MTPKQRYFETILFGNPDKIPLNPGHPRESTIKKWLSQGLPEGVDYLETAMSLLGIDPEARLQRPYVGANFKLVPEFESEILEHRDGHYIIRDWMGAVTEIADNFDPSYLQSAKDFVTRKWHKFPVENRADWDVMKKRYDPDEPSRFTEADLAYANSLYNDDNVVTMSFNGIFWQLREWCGFENLCMLTIDDPELVNDMAIFWTDFINEMLDRIMPNVSIDSIVINEDMAYKAHSMISPAMTRQFILPAYLQWVPKIKSYGCKVIEIDSDGCVDELIPIWIDAGINACSPCEVAAHCDIIEYRRKYGDKIAYLQGIDKRIMARGGQELEDHINSIVPELFKKGGFIPGCDHGVPPDISWDNYLYFIKLIAKLSGWL